FLHGIDVLDAKEECDIIERLLRGVDKVTSSGAEEQEVSTHPVIAISPTLELTTPLTCDKRGKNVIPNFSMPSSLNFLDDLVVVDHVEYIDVFCEPSMF
ncbi:UNVERIFIED_CONTAM: hypothetical protein ITH36_25095, partial [Salmonella enterica subsp. enterica serovar Weltevreden]